MAEVEPEVTTVIASVVCRDEDARYLVVRSPDGADTDWELPTGVVSVSEDLAPLPGEGSTLSLLGCTVVLVGEGPILHEEIDSVTAVHTFLGRLAGQPESLNPYGSRWLYPTSFHLLADVGQVDDITVRGINDADVRLSW